MSPGMRGAKPIDRPFLAAGLAVLGQALWLAVIRGEPCDVVGAWATVPFALALCTGVWEARAARRRGHGVFASISWGLALGAVTTLTAAVAQIEAPASGAGCFS